MILPSTPERFAFSLHLQPLEGSIRMGYQRSSRRSVRAALGLLAAASAAIVASCNEENHRHPNVRDLVKTSREWSRVTATGNVDAILGYWTDDAAVMIPGVPTFRGKAAIRQYVEQSLKTPGFRIKWKPVEAHISGNIGYMIERSTVTMPNSRGQLETHDFRVVTVWRKSADGKWRNVIDASIPD